MYTDTQDFQFIDREPRVLVVKTNGGSVEVQCNAGDYWITSDTYNADTATEMFFGNALIRIIPTGGAEFDIK
jgi:hypothetical protein